MGHDTDLQRQVILDVHRRTRAGGLAYLLCWVGISLGSGLARTEPGLSAAVAAAFTVTVVARGVLHRQLPALVGSRPAVANLLSRTLVLVNAGALGALAGLAMVWPPLSPARQGLMVTGAAMCAGVTISLAMDPWLRFGVALVILTPYGAGLAATFRAGPWTLLLLVAVFALGLWRASAYVHADYWRAARATLLLEQRAAELEHLSTTDPLTQLANRLHVTRRLGEEWTHAARGRRPLSLVLVDLDHFKRLNDTYGHPFGDRCLVAAAAALRDGARRAGDLVARFGGEEFLVLLPDTPAQDAADVAERLRRGVESLALTTDDGAAVHVTCSLGVVTVFPHRLDGEPSAAVSLADRALYAAKSAGRNQVVCAADPDAADPDAADLNAGSPPPSPDPYSTERMIGKPADRLPQALSSTAADPAQWVTYSP